MKHDDIDGMLEDAERAIAYKHLQEGRSFCLITINDEGEPIATHKLSSLVDRIATAVLLERLALTLEEPTEWEGDRDEF